MLRHKIVSGHVASAAVQLLLLLLALLVSKVEKKSGVRSLCVLGAVRIEAAAVLMMHWR